MTVRFAKPAAATTVTTTLFAGALLAGTALSTPALAQSEADTIAEALSTFIAEELIDKAGPEMRVELDGDVTVVEDGDGYHAEIPAITLGAVDEFDTKQMRIPAIGLTVWVDADGNYAAEGALPDAVQMIEVGADQAETVMGQLLFGASALAGTFSPELGLPTALDITIESFAVESPMMPPGAEFSIAGLTATLVTEEVEEGLFDSSSEVSLDGLTLVPGDGTSLSIGNVTLGAYTAAANLIVMRNLADSLKDAMEMMVEQPEADAAARLEEIAADVPVLFSELGFGISVSDFDSNMGGSPPIQDLAFDASVGLAGFEAETGTLDLDINYGGMQSPILAMMPGLIPELVGIDMTVRDIPVSSVGDAAMQATSGMAQFGPEMAAMVAMGVLQESLLSAGTTLDITSIDIQLPTSRFQLTGTLTGDATALLGATGAAEMVATGLDTLIEAASANPLTEQGAPMLSMLGAMGQIEGEPGPDSIRRYQLEATADGQILLNGTDLGAMMQ